MFSLKNFLMATLLIFALSVGGVAEAGIVTDKVPLQCYVDHKVKSYDKNNGREVGWIDAEVDLIQITGIGGNGVAIGTHPSGSRRVERIFWARDVFEDPGYRNRNVHVNGSHQVFRTKNSGATIGSIANEEVTVVADNGNRAQIIYRLNNGTGYKMGWVPSSIVANNQPVGANFQLSNYNLSNPSDHQLRFTGRVWNANNNSEITGVHVYIGGGVGAGGEFMGEFRSDSNHNFDATLNVPQHRNGNQLIVIYAVNGKDAGELNRTNINVSGGSTPSRDFPSSIYLTQVGKSTCTLVSAAMMLRAKAYLNGDGNWSSITESSLRNTAWIEHQGLRHSFNFQNIPVRHSSVSGISSSYLKNLLNEHPEGIVIHCKSLPHAVWVISYTGDTFYCSDPLGNYSGDKRPLANSYLGRKFGSQDNVLNNVTAFWYVP